MKKCVAVVALLIAVVTLGAVAQITREEFEKLQVLVHKNTARILSLERKAAQIESQWEEVVVEEVVVEEVSSTVGALTFSDFPSYRVFAGWTKPQRKKWNSGWVGSMVAGRATVTKVETGHRFGSKYEVEAVVPITKIVRWREVRHQRDLLGRVLRTTTRIRSKRVRSGQHVYQLCTSDVIALHLKKGMKVRFYGSFEGSKVEASGVTLALSNTVFQ